VELTVKFASMTQPQYQSQPTDTDVFSAKNVLLFLLTGLAVPALLSYILTVAHEAQVTAAIIGIIAMLLTLRFPFVGLILFAGLLYTRPEEVLPPLQGMRFSLIASLLTLTALTLRKYMDRERWEAAPCNGLMIAFGVIVVMSAAIGGGEPFGAIQDIGKLVLLYFITINLVNTPERYRQFVSALLLFTLYLACYSVYLYFTGAALKQADFQRSQATGIFGDPNDLAATIVAGLGMTLTRIVQAKGLMRVVYLLLAGFLVWSTLLTNSRGGMLSLLLVAGGFVLIYVPGKTAALFLALIVGVGLLKSAGGRMSEFDAGEESANSRFWFWDNGVNQLKSKPLTGVGYGMFESINGGMTAHNSYVLCFTELGIPGYFCWIGCLYYCFRSKIKPDSALPFRDPNRPIFPKARAKIKPNIATLPHERIGARLGLAGFLMAAFWISRTYVPILFLLISVPIAQSIAYSKPDELRVPQPKTKFRDYGQIAAISIGSILFIAALAYKLK
jgi:putative inorganic carbon (hco3(-)) transporter